MEITKVTIGHKEYEIDPKYGHFVKLMKKYPDMESITQWTMQKYNKFVFDAVWLILKRIGMFKPFYFKFRFKNAITLAELKWLQINIHTIILGGSEEDEKSGLGKSHTSKRTTS